MRNRKVLLGLACLAGSTMLISTAHADRRTGLSGNLLIQDADDLFPFPQLTLKHRNMLRLDYGPGAGANPAVGSNGNGVMTLGDENSAYGLAVHRGDLLSPDVVGQTQELTWLGGVGNPFGATSYGTFNGPGTPPTAVLPATVFDLFYARALGDNAFGARLGFGRGVASATVDGKTAKGAQTFFALQAGYSMLPPEGLRLDLSGNLVFALGKSTTVVAGDEEDVNSGTDIRLGLLGRGYIPMNAVLDVGFLANVTINREGTSRDTPKSSSSDLSAGLMAGVGPSINLERAKVAAYGGLSLGYGALEPDDEIKDDETSRIAVAAPMVNMAAEVQLLDWLYVRTGAQYVWGLNRTGGKNGAGDDTSAKTTAGTFGWTSGIGMQKDAFSFDGALSNGFVTGGPNFIGGTAPGFLAMASATYRFGEVLSGNVAPAAQETGETVAPEPAAPVEPAPEPEPAPAPEAAAPAVDGTATGEAGSTDTSVNAGGSIGVGIGKP